jgi:hypothetical protein
MESLLLLGICTVAWLAWLPAALLEKEARGDKGGTSIMPIIPFYPLVAWGVGLGLNALRPSAGLYVIGGLHIILLVVFLGSAALSAIKIKTKKSGSR